MEDVAFETFQKIPRLRRDIVITEKIDGTNAVIYIGDGDGVFKVGSRNRWITPESDNYTFAAWAYENRDKLVEFLGPGRHYGEWYGSGIQRRYGLGHKRWSLFNVRRYGNIPRDQFPDGVELVPVLYEGPWEDRIIDAMARRLQSNGSVAVPGFMNPEGIVVFHKASGHLYKFTLDGDAAKESKENPRGPTEAVTAA